MKPLIARVRSLLSTRARQYMDSQNITDMADLRRVLQSWESTENALIPEEKWPKPAKNFGVRTCFKCGKLGHRAAECRSNAEPQQKANPASGKPTFTCFSCGQAGHKSPDCPNRNGKESDEKKKDTARKTLKNNCIMTEDSTYPKVVKGKISDYEILLLLDTGAQISIIPEEIIPPAAKTGEVVSVKGFTGVAELSSIAKVKINVNGVLRDCEVALCPGEDMGDKGILAINLRDTDSFCFICYKTIPMQNDRV